MKKKYLSVILIASILLSIMPFSMASTVKYADVKGHWAESSIDRWTEYGIVQGNNGDFGADRNLTRAEFATILKNLLHLPVERPEDRFSDVADGKWYADAINSCAAVGIIRGNNGEAMPDAAITRAESITMICRALAIEEADENQLSDYSDVHSVPAYAAGYIAAAHELGIVKGTSDTTLSPLSNITRAQMMVILDRAIDTYVVQENASVTANNDTIVLVVAENAAITGSAKSVVIAPGAGESEINLKGLKVYNRLSVCSSGAVVNATNGTTIEKLAFGETTSNATVNIDASAIVNSVSSLNNGNTVNQKQDVANTGVVSGGGSAGGSSSSGGNGGGSSGDNSEHKHSYVAGICTGCGQSNPSNADRSVISLNGDWKFTDYNGIESTVSVPHDWNYYTAAAAYNPTLISKTVTYEKTVDISAYAGKQLFLQFDGVNKVAKVYVDDEIIDTHVGGYTAFAMDITKVCAGKSSITVKVENTNATFDTMPVNTDFTHYAGIYRDVNLVAVPASAYIALEDNGSQGVYLTNSVNLEENSATLVPRVKVSNQTASTVNAEVTVTLQDAAGNTVKSGSQNVALSAYTIAEDVELNEIDIADVHLWQGVDDPYLYTAKTVICVDGAIVDSNTQEIGFRTYEVREGQFFLNGKLYNLRGIGMHQQNNGSYVASKESVEEAIDYVREMGANALRTCHYPHSQYTYQLCDEEGIVV